MKTGFSLAISFRDESFSLISEYLLEIKDVLLIPYRALYRGFLFLHHSARSSLYIHVHVHIKLNSKIMPENQIYVVHN